MAVKRWIIPDDGHQGDFANGALAALYIEGGLVLAIFIIGAAIAHFSTVLQ